MVWKETGKPISCNGYKAACFSKDPELMDIRENITSLS